MEVLIGTSGEKNQALGIYRGFNGEFEENQSINDNHLQVMDFQVQFIPMYLGFVVFSLELIKTSGCESHPESKSDPCDLTEGQSSP